MTTTTRRPTTTRAAPKPAPRPAPPPPQRRPRPPRRPPPQPPRPRPRPSPPSRRPEEHAGVIARAPERAVGHVVLPGSGVPPVPVGVASGTWWVRRGGAKVRARQWQEDPCTATSTTSDAAVSWRPKGSRLTDAVAARRAGRRRGPLGRGGGRRPGAPAAHRRATRVSAPRWRTRSARPYTTSPPEGRPLDTDTRGRHGDPSRARLR